MSFYAIYNLFRISDEESKYNLASIGEHSGNVDTHITWCKINTGYENCTCQKSCENPHECLDTCDDEDICICPDDYYLKEGLCVQREECGCYAFEGILIPEGGVYANSDCTRLATCEGGKLRWNDFYECGDNEVCEETMSDSVTVFLVP
ncbi:Zonadhesin [Holothuria leucospilota]|uniref:Zonadhesin n=1 Tax=Holothuria leucospilota TaxID=206669 RepID=A0A9Q1HHY5_HOLLE|nr:Zonadhesin [Holothuria leucospilota]